MLELEDGELDGELDGDSNDAEIKSNPDSHSTSNQSYHQNDHSNDDLNSKFNHFDHNTPNEKRDQTSRNKDRKRKRKKDDHDDKKKSKRRYVDHDKMNDAKLLDSWPGYASKSQRKSDSPRIDREHVSPRSSDSSKRSTRSPHRPQDRDGRDSRESRGGRDYYRDRDSKSRSSRKYSNKDSNRNNKSNSMNDTQRSSPPGPYDSPSDTEEYKPPPERNNRSSRGHRGSRHENSLSDDDFIDSSVAAHEKESSYNRNSGRKNISKRRQEKNREYKDRKKFFKDRDRDRDSREKKVDSKRPCRYFKEGTCHKGSDCQFNHDFMPPKKREVCKYYLSSYCSKGDNCTFMHGTFPCKFYHTGQDCYQGENCKFSHADLDEDGKMIINRIIEKNNQKRAMYDNFTQNNGRNNDNYNSGNYDQNNAEYNQEDDFVSPAPFYQQSNNFDEFDNSNNKFNSQHKKANHNYDQDQERNFGEENYRQNKENHNVNFSQNDQKRNDDFMYKHNDSGSTSPDKSLNKERRQSPSKLTVSDEQSANIPSLFDIKVFPPNENSPEHDTISKSTHSTSNNQSSHHADNSLREKNSDKFDSPSVNPATETQNKNIDSLLSGGRPPRPGFFPDMNNLPRGRQFPSGLPGRPGLLGPHPNQTNIGMRMGPRGMPFGAPIPLGPVRSLIPRGGMPCGANPRGNGPLLGPPLLCGLPNMNQQPQQQQQQQPQQQPFYANRFFSPERPLLANPENATSGADPQNTQAFRTENNLSPVSNALLANMPAQQRELFLRIQQRQLQDNQNVPTDSNVNREDENWYSSDEDDSGKKSKDKTQGFDIVQVLSNLRKESSNSSISTSSSRDPRTAREDSLNSGDPRHQSDPRKRDPRASTNMDQLSDKNLSSSELDNLKKDSKQSSNFQTPLNEPSLSDASSSGLSSTLKPKYDFHKNTSLSSQKSHIDPRLKRSSRDSPPIIPSISSLPTLESLITPTVVEINCSMHNLRHIPWSLQRVTVEKTFISQSIIDDPNFSDDPRVKQQIKLEKENPIIALQRKNSNQLSSSPMSSSPRSSLTSKDTLPVIDLLHSEKTSKTFESNKSINVQSVLSALNQSPEQSSLSTIYSENDVSQQNFTISNKLKITKSTPPESTEHRRTDTYSHKSSSDAGNSSSDDQASKKLFSHRSDPRFKKRPRANSNTSQPQTNSTPQKNQLPASFFDRLEKASASPDSTMPVLEPEGFSYKPYAPYSDATNRQSPDFDIPHLEESQVNINNSSSHVQSGGVLPAELKSEPPLADDCSLKDMFKGIDPTASPFG